MTYFQMTRQIRRLAEKENKKERDKAKKVFVGVVRNLALKVKKWDPRVQADLKQQEAQRLEREAAAAAAAKAKAAARESVRRRYPSQIRLNSWLASLVAL